MKEKEKRELIRDRKLSDLIDRIGERNLTILLKMPKKEKVDILKRIKKLKNLTY